MSETGTSSVIEQQMKHRSVRKYTGEPIAPDTLAALLRAGQAAASSNFVQAYSVVRVTDPQARKRIAAAAGGQVWVEEAAEFLVFCADLRRIDRACRHAGYGPVEGWTEHSLVAVVDATLMAQNVLLAAESVGLGGVFIGGIRNDPQVVVDQLELPEQVAPLFGMCLGWPADEAEVKPRMPLDLILHQDKYRDPGQEELDAYDATVAGYYRSRQDQSRDSNWSINTVQIIHGKKREHMLAFLRERGFFRK